MTDYAVVLARSATRELARLHEPLSSKILERIESLAGNPRPPGCRKLEGADDLWRIRIGDYRVLYSVDDKAGLVDVIAVRHRRDAYR